MLYVIGILLVIFTLFSLHQFILQLSFGATAPNSLPILLNLLLDIGFLYYAYKFSKDKKQQDLLATALNKPASEFLNKKLPGWLILYAVIIVAIIVYLNFAGTM